MFDNEKWQAMRDELGYWEVETSHVTKLGAVIGKMSHVDYNGLMAMIDDYRANFDAEVSDPVFWPPVENHIVEFEQLARCLDAEEFLTSGKFRNGLADVPEANFGNI